MAIQNINRTVACTIRNIKVFLIVISIIHTINNQTIYLGSEYTAIYLLNLTKISALGSDNSLIITSLSQNRVIFNKTIQAMIDSVDDGLKRIQIHNYESSARAFNIIISTAQNSTDNEYLSMSLMQSKITPPTNHFGVLMLKQNIYDYMLPFNLLSQKYEKVFVEQNISSLEPVSYDYQPFLETYWNEKGQNQILMNWIPYFSKCQYHTSSRIFLEDVVNPIQVIDSKLRQIQAICNSSQSWFWGNSLDCTEKTIQTKCILQQLKVKNTKKQPWWLNTQSTIFYFINHGIIQNSLLQLDQSTNLQGIAQQYYNKLLPVSFVPNFALNSEIPNSFELSLKISSIENINQVKILQATLTASKSSNNQLQQDETFLYLKIQYLSNFNTLLLYGKSTYLYVIIYCVIMLVFVLTFRLLSILFNVNLYFSSVIKLILFPLLKGFSMAFLVSAIFLLFFFFLTSITNYAVIVVNFNNDQTENLWDSYAGRVGLSVFFVGYFLLSAGIDQSFKVLTIEQIKIMLEDDLMEKKKQHRTTVETQNSQECEDKPKFIIKNMNSHRKYLFTCIFTYSFVLLFLYYVQLNFDSSIKILFIFFGYPLIHKITIIIYRHYVAKELLYLSPILVAFTCFTDLIVMGNMYLWETILFYLAKIVAENFICVGLQIFTQAMALKVQNYLDSFDNREQASQPTNMYMLLYQFAKQIKSVVSECRYQKSIFYGNLYNIKFGSILTRPFLLLVIFISIEYNFICKDLNQSQQQLLKASTILFCFIPIDVVFILMGIKLFESKLNLEIIKCLQFNKFKFNRRKVKWINDTFVHNNCIQYFYREFQKFCFSSQFYLLLFLISFSILTLVIGLKIILEVSYVSFLDPAMLIIVLIVWFSGNLFSMILSFLVIKLKFYERKQDVKMRAKLENVEKILKKLDYSEYLSVEGVKNYFLFHRKEWIINNITRIFDKQDLLDNNYEFLTKYQHYKSLLKKKQIEDRKKNEQKHQFEQIKNNQVQQMDKKQVVKLPGKQFNQLAKPIICTWLYIAKQFTFLKALVTNLKIISKKQTCQFCSMNIELEVIEKIQFANIINQYRILNVGRIFQSSHFIQFYKYRQQYITVCIQCKDRKLYLQKKHLDINGSPKNILYKWLVIARSRLLHREGKAIKKKY